MATIGYTEEPGYLYISLKSPGGAIPGPSLAQKTGPLGISPKGAGEDFKKATMEYASLKINCRLAIKDRKATVEVTPGTATLLIKRLNEPVRDRKKEKNILHNGNLTMQDIVEVAKLTKFKSHSKSFLGTVLQVIGTCGSFGCSIEGKTSKEITAAIKSGEIVVSEN